MTSRINAVRSTAPRSVSFDVGPSLINAVNQIGPNTDNPTIDRLAANIAGKLQNAGVRNTKWVGEMLYQMRGTHQGVGGDKSRFIGNVNKAASLGVLGPNGKATLLSKVGAASDAQDNRSRVENSMLNVKNQSQPRKRDLFETPELLKGTKYEYKKQDLFTQLEAQKKSKPASVQQKKTDVPTPQLDAVISSLDKATKVMPDGVIKSSLNTVKSSLELARTAQKNGDTVAYTKAIGGLSENMMKTIGEVVKRFGQDGELAAQAATQLGKIAGVIGKGVKVVGVVDDLSKLVRGKSLSGAEATPSARADAAFNLVTKFLGPVGTAASIAKAKLEWCYEHIGIPAKQALTEYGLKRLFGGQTAEQMREGLRSLPVDDPNKAQWALDVIFRKTFKATSSGFSQATAMSLWETFRAKEMQGYNDTVTFLNQHAKTKPGTNPEVDAARVRMAQAYQRAALRFIDAQVADAKGSWPV